MFGSTEELSGKLGRDGLFHRSGDDQGRVSGGQDAETVAARRAGGEWQDWYMLSFEGCEDRFTSELFDRVFSSTSCSATSISPACCSPRCSWQPPDLFTLLYTTRRTKSH